MYITNFKALVNDNYNLLIMNDQANIEGDMHSFSPGNSRSPTSHTLLPYNFDDECHVVINNNFYMQSPLYAEEEIFDLFGDQEMKIDLSGSFEKIKIEEFEPEVESEAKAEDGGEVEVEVEMVDVSKKIVSETESVISTEASDQTMGTMPFVIPIQGIHTLDAQLDFIMETTKKHQKPREKYQRRNRKTPQQLKILIDELGNEQNANKSQMKEVAKKTGLTELQVYKWYWDRKAKAN